MSNYPSSSRLIEAALRFDPADFPVREVVVLLFLSRGRRKSHFFPVILYVPCKLCSGVCLRSECPRTKSAQSKGTLAWSQCAAANFNATDVGLLLASRRHGRADDFRKYQVVSCAHFVFERCVVTLTSLRQWLSNLSLVRTVQSIP